MGWRFRRRIKILPGIHINISKSGISTNVGVKGASVTFGQNGTFVNTGIPGIGLYRRDKISGSEQKSRKTDNILYVVSNQDSEPIANAPSPKGNRLLCALKKFIRKIGLLHGEVQERIEVFTHQGDLVKLPKGATILDLAYYIHPCVGSQCVGACVNNNEVNLGYQIQNGDHVEIKTSPYQEPLQEWLNFVTTSQAKEMILHSLQRKQEKDDFTAEPLDKEGINPNRAKNKTNDREHLDSNVSIADVKKCHRRIQACPLGETKQSWAIERLNPKASIPHTTQGWI